jgi:uncharacterized protein
VALLDRSERHHRACVGALRDNPASLVTCEAVIAESCYLLRGLSGAADAVLENVERKVFDVRIRLDDCCSAVRRHMKRYERQPMDLADACLVELAARLQVGRIFTLDSDFRVYRWGKNRSFDLLP